MSDTAANLLSGLIGAIVGGALSLAGSIIVNRKERRTAIRHQLYLLAAEIVPSMDKPPGVSELPGDDLSRDINTRKQLDTMSRLGAIAGPTERRLTHQAKMQWLKARRAGLPDKTSYLTDASNALDELLELLQRKLADSRRANPGPEERVLGPGA